MKRFQHLLYVLPLFILWYTADHLNGSFSLLSEVFTKYGFTYSIYEMVFPGIFGSKLSWTLSLCFSLLALPILKKANVWILHVVTVLLFGILSYGLHIVSPALFYHQYASFLLPFSLVLASLPQIEKRAITLMLSLVIFSSIAAQETLYGISLSMLITASLQLFYLAINKVRFPYLFLIPTFYLVHHPFDIPLYLSLTLFTLGAAFMILGKEFKRHFLEFLAILLWSSCSGFMNFYPYLYVMSIAVYFIWLNLKEKRISLRSGYSS